jgi:3-oxoacyl-[acyl-carrier protein] reductase
MSAGTASKRVVLITGASRGLGKAIALAFGSAGDNVVINYLNRDRDAAAVADEIAGGSGQVMLFRADVKIPDEVDALVNAAMSRWGRIDVLVNNAGITRDCLLLRMTEQEWDGVLDTNLSGAFLCIRSVSKIMSRQRTGHIVNISSIAGLQGREGQANYSAAKAGLIGLTKASAKELGRFNIKVNAVLPGYVPTDMGNSVSDAVLKRILTANALNRVSEAAEVADFVYHLSRMNNVSGQVFNLDSRVV